MANTNKSTCSLSGIDMLMYAMIAYLLYVIIAQKPLIPTELKKPVNSAVKPFKPIYQPVAKAVKPIANPIVKAGTQVVNTGAGLGNKVANTVDDSLKKAPKVIKHAGNELGQIGNEITGYEGFKGNNRNSNVEKMTTHPTGYTHGTDYASL